MYIPEEILSVLSSFLSFLNHYFLLILVNIEELKGVLITRFNSNPYFDLVTTKLSNFETRVRKFDPYTIIISAILLCYSLKVIKRVIWAILSTFCI